MTFTRIATSVTRAVGSSRTFVACCASIIVWAACGPYFHYSDQWQLVVNTTTSVITFLMVFVIQNASNRDNAALHAKLDELLKSSNASNELIGLELAEPELVEELRTEIMQHAEKSTQ